MEAMLKEYVKDTVSKQNYFKDLSGLFFLDKEHCFMSESILMHQITFILLVNEAL